MALNKLKLNFKYFELIQFSFFIFSDEGLFEQRVLEYREEMSETSNKQGNVKVVYKKIVDFFKESGKIIIIRYLEFSENYFVYSL